MGKKDKKINSFFFPLWSHMFYVTVIINESIYSISKEIIMIIIIIIIIKNW